MNRFRTTLLGVILLTAAFAAEGRDISALDSLLARYNSYAAWYSPEKVYLHFDRTCFTAGETIWFKGWTREASSSSVLPPSNFIYVEILDNHGETVARVKIKRSGNGFPGCIELPENLETGNYTLRAYSLWQLNNGDEYLFNESIRIIGESVKPEKSLKPPTAGALVSFWPEGGRYFASHRAVIGFKATDGAGRSLDFEGQLVNDQGTEVKLVFTVHDGMGVFSFLPEPGRSYSVRDASGKLHPLPPPAEEGGSLQLLTRSGRYYVSALGFGGGTANLLLRDATELRPIAEIDLDGKAGAIMLEREFCRPGINHLLLLDPRGRILAERLFFVRDYDAPACSVDVERFTAVPGDPVRATVVLVKPDGTPLDGNCSVSVVRGALKDWRQGDGIVSYMGLSSELKGRINDPCYYFDPKIPEPERDVALDLLMMIQGWRYYDLERITGINEDSIKIKYLRERVQELRGHISRRLSSRMPKNFIFTFLIPQQNILQSVEVARGRRFVIDSLDFQENTGMLINIGSSRLGAHYLPKWDGDPAAGPYIYKPAPGFAGSLKLPEPLQSETMRGDTLAGAVVTASYTEDDVLVFGRSYREDLLTFKDMTLVEYLSMTKAMFEYDGEYMYNRSRKRNRSAYDGRAEESDDSWDTGEENDSGRVKLIVEDSEEEWWSFDMLRLEDLRSLSISTQPDPVYGGDGGVVHIVVKPGGLRRDTDRNPSLLYFVPLGYQATRYFEAAGYIQGESGVAGKRNTVWWSPDVPVSQGRGVFEFRNDNSCDYPFLIRIEGIDTEGRPFSCHSLVSPE